MTERSNNFDLEDRTYEFAVTVLDFVTRLPKTVKI